LRCTLGPLSSVIRGPVDQVGQLAERVVELVDGLCGCHRVRVPAKLLRDGQIAVGSLGYLGDRAVTDRVRPGRPVESSVNVEALDDPVE
jgi:hypothetical protein